MRATRSANPMGKFNESFGREFYNSCSNDLKLQKSQNFTGAMGHVLLFL